MTNQISMFELIDTEFTLAPDRQQFRKELRKGSNIVESTKRIKEKALTLSKEEFIEALKKEYGIGGWFGPENSHVWFDSKGFYVNYFEENERKYSWTQVANEILDMIDTNSY